MTTSRKPTPSVYTTAGKECECGQTHGKFWTNREDALHECYFAHRDVPVDKRPRGCNCRACKGIKEAQR